MSPDSPAPELRRTLGVLDAVLVGLGSMLGAGIFAALAPAARTAGSWLLLAVAIAGAVAYCNAMSSARLAALYPVSGGTYVYGRARLGDFWGYLAGWGFVVGKTASCAAMALTVGYYAWPEHAHAVAVVTVAVVTAVNYVGIQKSAWVTRFTVAAVLIVLGAVVVSVFCRGAGETPTLTTRTPASVSGVLQAAGLLFFAFAGYARIATLGEEVRDPARVIPKAVRIALLSVVAVYAVVAAAVLAALGPHDLAAAVAPVAAAARAVGAGWLVPVVGVAAVLAATGALLALLLGVSRTVLAMARDGHLPRALSAVHPRFAVPYRAELAVGATVGVLATVADLRTAIGFSSFAVLTYYAITNASALTLAGGRVRAVAVAGGIGCAVLAFTLPPASILAGSAVLGVGALVYALHRRRTTD